MNSEWNSFCFLLPIDEPAYLGCFRDNLPRDLQVYIPTHPATIGACVDTCKSQGFSVGALRNSDLCFCGNAYRKSSQVADKECDMPCYDNSFEVCGGFMTFSQYWTGKTRKRLVKTFFLCQSSKFRFHSFLHRQGVQSRQFNYLGYGYKITFKLKET